MKEDQTICANPGPADAPDFERGAREVLLRLRNTVSELCEALPGGVKRAVDLQRQLGLDSKTSWRLHRIASTVSDPLSIGSHVPGRGSMTRLRNEAEKLEVAGDLLDKMLDAYNEFERFVKQFAGDRTTFDTMISAYAGDDAGQIDLAARRAAFRANSHIWGLQSRADVVTYIVHRSQTDPDQMDVVMIQGQYDLKYLRRGAVWDFTEVQVLSNDNEYIPAQPEPLFGLTEETEDVLDEYSDLAKSMRMTRQSGGYARVELSGDAIGLPSASTYFFGYAFRSVVPRYRSDTEQYLRSNGTIKKPTEVFYCNLLLDASVFHEVDPRTMLLSGLAGTIADPTLRPELELPNHDQAHVVGSGPAALATPELPRYSEMVDRVLTRMGWQDSRFTSVHLRTEYPPLPSSTFIEVALPERE